MLSSHFSSLDHYLSIAVEERTISEASTPDHRGAGDAAGDADLGEYVALIIAYRDHSLVESVLAQLEAQAQLPHQVLIVDNGGTLTDADLESMPLCGRTLLISRPDNPGYGVAVNSARDHLGDRALLVLTHDAEFTSSLATHLLRTLREPLDAADALRVGCVAPLLKFAAQRDRVFSAGGAVTRGGRASHLTEPKSARPYPVAWVDGAIAMYSAEALQAIDWIAEDYFLYFEDVDTGWRLSQTGFASVVVPTEIAYQQTGAHPMYLGIRNMTLFAYRSGVHPMRQFGAVIHRVSREAAGRLRRRKPLELRAAWRGWRDGRSGLSGKPGG